MPFSFDTASPRKTIALTSSSPARKGRGWDATPNSVVHWRPTSARPAESASRSMAGEVSSFSGCRQIWDIDRHV